jgi:lysozyme family protein
MAVAKKSTPATPVKTTVVKKAPVKKAPVKKTPVAKTPSNLFQRALEKILIHEGGKVDHPADPGGRTNKGITQRVYNGWRGKSNLPLRDVYDISDGEVEAIYRFQYWEPCGADQMDFGVGYVVFDGAVNSGVKQSLKWLQRALGALYTGTIDGVWGTMTADAISLERDADALIARICERRLVFLKALKTWKTFGKGWSRRVADVLKVGQAWAEGSAAPDIRFIEGGNAKATMADAKSATPTAPGDATAGVGGGGLISGGALTQVQEQLAPYTQFDWVATIIVWLVIIGAVLTVGGLVWRFFAKGKNVALADALDTPVGTKPVADA